MLPELCQQFSTATAVGGVSFVDYVRITAQPKNAKSPLGGPMIWLQQPEWAAFCETFLARANLGVPRGGLRVFRQQCVGLAMLMHVEGSNVAFGWP